MEQITCKEELPNLTAPEMIMTIKEKVKNALRANGVKNENVTIKGNPQPTELQKIENQKKESERGINTTKHQ